MPNPNAPSGPVPGISDLKLSSDQKEQLREEFKNKTFPSKLEISKLDNESRDREARAALEPVGLWPLPIAGITPEGMGVRWTRTNTVTTGKATSKSRSRIIVFQCRCGVDSSSRKGYKGKRNTTLFKYTSCLAHCRVSVSLTNVGGIEKEGAIRWIQGFFDHNEECREAKQLRAPKFSLEPMVKQIAICQLRQGFSTEKILDDNVQFVKKVC